MRKLLLACAMALYAVPLSAQTLSNPSAVTFTCPDHAQDTGHGIDIINAAGVVVQTLAGGDPPADANGDVTVVINVQPVTFGLYTVKVRATAGSIKSPNSPASDVWARSPGSPTKPEMK